MRMMMVMSNRKMRPIITCHELLMMTPEMWRYLPLSVIISMSHLQNSWKLTGRRRDSVTRDPAVSDVTMGGGTHPKIILENG